MHPRANLEMLSARRGYAGPTGSQTHYREGGEGSATILIHGTGFDSSFWMRAIPRLGRGRRVIAPDLAGYGLSDRPPQPVTELSYYGDRIVAMLDALGIERAHLVGFHTGASIAVDIAARFPQRIGGLVLAGFLALHPQAERDRWYRDQVAPSMDPGDDPLRTARHLDEQTSRWKTFDSSSDPERYRAMLVARVIAAPAEYSTYPPLRDFDVYGAVDRVEHPTLVIHFDRDVVPLEVGRAAAERIAGSRFVILEGEAHALLADPAAACELIARQLDEFDQATPR